MLLLFLVHYHFEGSVPAYLPRQPGCLPTYLANLVVHCVSLCLKNVYTLSCYYFDIHVLILTVFGRNVIAKLSNQKMLYFPTSPKMTKITKYRLRCLLNTVEEIVKMSR